MKILQPRGGYFCYLATNQKSPLLLPLNIIDFKMLKQNVKLLNYYSIENIGRSHKKKEGNSIS